MGCIKEASRRHPISQKVRAGDYPCRNRGVPIFRCDNSRQARLDCIIGWEGGKVTGLALAVKASSLLIVYVIDDDRDVRDSISFMLRTDGIDSRSFAGGDEFMAAQPNLPRGCLLLDVRMPRMSGLEVLTALSARGCTWPVVVMTGHGETDLGSRAIELGARDVIEKPFDADLLFHCLRRSS